VHLVNLRRTPLVEITERGLRTTESEYEFDAIVFATGFDAMTGALLAVDIRGVDGASLREKWEHARTRTSAWPSTGSRTCSRSPGRRARRCSAT
jgi:cation diffusion facilitator CzcD-associated flavoprotein CzcO